MWHDQKLLLSVDSAFVSSAHYTSCYHPNRVTSNYTYSCITVLPSSKLSLDLQTHMNTMVLVDIIQVFALFSPGFLHVFISWNHSSMAWFTSVFLSSLLPNIK